MGAERLWADTYFRHSGLPVADANIVRIEPAAGNGGYPTHAFCCRHSNTMTTTGFRLHATCRGSALTWSDSPSGWVLGIHELPHECQRRVTTYDMRGRPGMNFN